ncbi:MAG: polysaccharide deacetylase family protein [Actinomycetota bacterium]|nr:polysaccharide deacetylase family protein [Actinomycetota bacterium]
MTILCYHSVDDSWSSTLVVSPDIFATQCAWLARNRKVIDVEDAARMSGRNGSLPRNHTALTFDDGYEALYHHARPPLHRHGLPATVFLVAQTLMPEGRTVDWIDNPPAVPPATLTIDQILELQEEGWRFESHSLSHHVLTELTEAECVKDLKQSREVLGDLLGKEVSLLAYPRGRHDEKVRRAARDAGFDYAFSLPEQNEHVGKWAVPRVGIYPGNGLAALAAKSSGWYLRFRTSGVFPMVRRAVKGSG